MNSKPPSRKRPLTAEEAEIWAYAMRDAKKRAAKKPQTPVDSKAAEPPRTQQSQLGRTSKKPSPQRQAPPPPRAENSKPYTPPLAHFDQRQKRKLLRNSENIDGRIDLHGMRQNEAYAALRRFLLASSIRGDRTVLVITGKGRRVDLERTRDYMAEERGVLRRLVPQWMAEPELRGIVVSYTTAGPRHGGDGALYVRIRKAK